MSTDSHKPRGRPFQPGNPGRPHGSKNKTTQIVERLAEQQAEKLIEKVVELAQAGDVSCLRMLLDRLWPVRRGQPVHLNIPEIKSADDVPAVLAAIWTAVGDGLLTPEEASALVLLATRSMEAIQLQDILKRVEDLERERKGDEPL
jgi:Family of unknown function (DUF5681)